MEVIIGLVIVGVSIMLYGYLSRKRIYAEVDRLEASKIEVMNRPVTDELGKVKELNMTGQTEELFEKWRSEWDEIITTKLPRVEDLLFDAEELADKYRFKKSKNILLTSVTMLEDIDKEIDDILEELKQLVGSEEKNRDEIDNLTNVYKNLRKLILTNRHQYGKAAVTFERQIDELKERFEAFHEASNGGNYIEAREILLSTASKVDQLEGEMKELPELLIECTSFLPMKISEIKDGSKEMLADGYELSHLNLDEEVANIESEIAHLVERIESVELDTVKEVIGETRERIELIYDRLEDEVNASQFVQKEIVEVETEIQSLLAESFETNEETKFVQQTYQLSEEELEQFHEIKKSIQIIERNYHSVREKAMKDHLAYSIVKDELESILTQINQVKVEHENYCEMLQTLRKDELQAREQIVELKRKLIEMKRLIEKSNIPGLPESYISQFIEAQQDLHTVAKALDGKPLEMNAVNGLLEKATGNIEVAYRATREIIEQVYLVERVIQYANRYRSSSKQMAESLKMAEEQFREYDYGEALEEAAAALEKIEPGALKRLEDMIREIND